MIQDAKVIEAASITFIREEFNVLVWGGEIIQIATTILVFVSILLLKPACAVDISGGVSSQKPTKMEIPPCSNSPNCVSSMAWGKQSFVEPLGFSDTAEEALKRAKNIIQNLSCSTIVDEQKHSLYAELRSRIFGFVDELHLLVDSENKVIHIRSASRVGYWDFGVNRRRVERIRAQFN